MSHIADDFPFHSPKFSADIAVAEHQRFLALTGHPHCPICGVVFSTFGSGAIKHPHSPGRCFLGSLYGAEDYVKKVLDLVINISQERTET